MPKYRFKAQIAPFHAGEVVDSTDLPEGVTLADLDACIGGGVCVREGASKKEVAKDAQKAVASISAANLKARIAHGKSEAAKAKAKAAAAK